jgi:alpha-tubulin suppressor-like RCC1 family protein
MGQLGTGDQLPSSTPARVTGNLIFASLAAGATHTCGLTAAGQTFCWGLNDHGQLGSVAGPNCFSFNYYDYYDTITLDCALGPQPVNTTLSFVAISAGYGTCGLTSSGDVSCAGFSDAIRPVSNGVRFARLTAGGRCGLTSDGIAQCWTPVPGDDDMLAGTPIGEGNGMAFSSASAGAQHQCGVQAGDGSVMCWGRNDSGQLGNGTKATSNTPLPVSRPITP